MTNPVFLPDSPAAVRVEITNGTQQGPSKVIGQFGTRLDYSDVGCMTFAVDVVDVEGNRLTLFNGASYEAAIIEAEEAGHDWEVPVDDLVTPTADT